MSQVPQPVHAVLLLFPITDKSEKAKDEEGAKIKAEGQTCSDKASPPPHSTAHPHTIGKNPKKEEEEVTLTLQFVGDS